MLRKIFLILGLSVLASSAQPVSAATLTFDDVPGGSVQNDYGDMPTYQGFDFSFTLDWIDVVGSPAWNFGAHSGDFAILNNNHGAGTITAADSSDFTFDGLWAKKWATPPDSNGPDTLFGTLRGYNNGLLVWTVLTGLNGSYEFYGPQAGAIDELILDFGNNFLVDDLTLNGATTAVPDSTSTLVLMIIVGLVGVVVVQRWRLASA
jgi:hypothetical protein